MKICHPNNFSLDKQHQKNVFPFFYNPLYEQVLKKAESKEIFIIEDLEGNSMAFKKWKNKFLNFAQPLYPPLNKEGERLTKKEEKKFLDDFATYLQKTKMVHRITQPENFAIFQDAPTGSVSAPFGTYFIDLSKNTEEELFKNLHSKHRNVIRNAEKKEVVIKYGNSVLPDFYALYKQTMERSNMFTQSLNYFQELFNTMPENVLCGVAYYKQIPQGGLFMLYSGFGAFYLYGASSEKTEMNGAINFLHWNTIKILKEKGVKRYDFVGARLSDVSNTKLEGIQQFKERFGSELEKGLIWKKDINKAYCSLFDNLVTLKLLLKRKEVPVDLIDQERKKMYA